jgi:hypothetical protein
MLVNLMYSVMAAGKSGNSGIVSHLIRYWIVWLSQYAAIFNRSLYGSHTGFMPCLALSEITPPVTSSVNKSWREEHVC